MRTLYIDHTTRTPKIRFSEGNLLIWGTFVPVDPLAFYLPLLAWVKQYSISPATETIVDIGIKYTGGFWMPYIEKLLQELIMLHNEQHKVIVNWHFSPDSIDVKAGEYLSRKLDHPFNFVEVEEIW